MNILKTLRKPYLATILASIFLLASCSDISQTEDTTQSFNYESFNTFKNTNHLDNILNKIQSNKLKKSKSTTLEKNKLILSEVNKELNTNVILPDAALSMSIEMEIDDIYNQSLSNGWIKSDDIKLAKDFANDAQKLSFDLAVENYENKVLAMNLTDEEFAQKNLFLNVVKTINYEKPTFFTTDSNLYGKSWWRCGLAMTALIASTASMASCVTIGGCVLAIALVYNASLAVGEQC